jgi:hypothetical protein
VARPVATSQTRTAPLEPPKTVRSGAAAVAIQSAARENATHPTGPVWPRSVRSRCPVSASHRTAILSCDAVASRLPSGLYCTR